MSSFLDAQSTCKQIANRLTDYGKYKDMNDQFRTFTDPASMWRNKSDSMIMNSNISYLDLSQQDIININNSCSNLATSSQINNLIQSPNCITNAFEICKDNKGVINDTCYSKVADLITIKNVNQLNVSNIKEECQLNNLVKKLSSKDANIDTASAVLAAQRASGIGSQVDGITSNCNEIRQDMSSKDFLTSILSCSNQISNKQVNSFEACGGSNINQQNINDAFQRCLVSSGIYTEQKSVSTIQQKLESKVDQTAATIDFGALFGNPIVIVIIVVVLLVCSVVLFLLNKK